MIGVTTQAIRLISAPGPKGEKGGVERGFATLNARFSPFAGRESSCEAQLSSYGLKKVTIGVK
jgi:hypothetical protein